MSDTYGSDDQSIDDQADTATGGLANDMPGLPSSPPGKPPSALGGIAQAFQRMMGGAPAARPAQPGRSPFQFPGQSQVPAQPGQQGAQPQPRWQGTTASLALPMGSPQPRARFTPFISPTPTTNYTQWGQEQQFPNLPQSFEAPGILGNLSKFFGQNGSASIIPLALSMGKNGAAFINGVMQGQEFAAKMHREKMQDDAYELEQKMKSELHDYYDITDEYRTVEGTDKPTGSYAINGVTLLDALANKARQNGDDQFLGVLGTGSVEKAMQFIHRRNDNWQTLVSTNKSMQKQEDEDAKKELGIPDDQAGQDANRGEAHAQAAPVQAPGQPQTPQGGPASTMTPGGPASQTPQGDENIPLKPYQELGNSYLRGEGNISSQRAAVRPAISNWMAQQQQKIDQVKNDVASGKLRREDIPAALDRIMPGYGADYTEVDKGAPLPTGVQGRSVYWQSIRTLIPGFNPVVQQQTQKDFAPGGKDGTRMAAGARMPGAAITVLQEMKKFPEGTTIPENVLSKWIATGVTGDPKWSNLFQAVNNYMQDNQALQSPTGRFFESEMIEQRRNLNLTMGLPAIRGLLKVDAENSRNQMDVLKDNYRRGTRSQDDPPTYDPERAKELDALSMLDEQRGFADVPQDKLPEKLRGLGLGAGAEGATKIPSGWTVTPMQ